MDRFELERFLDAQDGTYDTVLHELQSGAKQSHWMWFIFPQLAALGQSSMAKYYGIRSLEEAHAYLGHPLLGPRLRECVTTLLRFASVRTAVQIFGVVDALKLRSSLTLFDQIEHNGHFSEGLAAFYEGEPDERTLALLNVTR